MPNLMIYGAYGYSGELISRQAVEQGLKPILAGRNPAPLEALARDLGLEWVAFDLSDASVVGRHLMSVRTVLNCAGPFALTWKVMTQACLATGTDYVDITGEIPVIEGCIALDGAARSAGIAILPAAAFDVVPTDCMAAMLKDRLPDATSLTLAFGGLDQPSRGTMRTGLRGMKYPIFVRKNNALTPRQDTRPRDFDFGQGPKRCYPFTWGDISSAWFNTRIPDIEVYLQPSGPTEVLLKLPLWARRLLASPLGKPLVNHNLKKTPVGPDKTARARTRCQIYGRAENASGKIVEFRFSTRDGYDVTAIVAPMIAAAVMDGKVADGYSSPAGAMGSDFILSIDGTRVSD